MMNYELFKKIAGQRILEFMPEEFAEWRVDIHPVNKVNGVQDGFCVAPPVHDSMLALPTLYLEDLYEDFILDEDMDRVLTEAASVFVRYSGRRSPQLAALRLEEHVDSIVFNLVGASLNRHMLDEIPHREFLDMAIIYRVVTSTDECGLNTAIITNDLMKTAGLTEEDLYQHSMQNTGRLFPIRILDQFDDRFMVITNQFGAYGASVMLYEEEMRKLSDRFGGDFYILPSSVHEFFAVAAAGSDPVDLSRMLADGNRNITPPREQLSTIIYRYVREHQQVIRYLGYLTE